jgi:hypothetical protein
MELGLTNSLGYDTAQALRDAGMPTAVQTARTRGALACGDGGHGPWRWDAASTADDNLGTVLLPTGHTGAGRWVRLYAGPINARWFGCVGDTTDESAKLQAALDAAPVVFLPNPSGANYLFANVTLQGSTVAPIHGQRLIGEDKFSCYIRGNGVDPVFIFGEQAAPGQEQTPGSKRLCQLEQVRVVNDGAECLKILWAPDWGVRNCSFQTINAGEHDTVYVRFSWNGYFENNSCVNSGATNHKTSALRMFDNCNGVRVIGNRMSGGVAGGAITFGLSQGGVCIGNIIEVSKYGIRAAATGPMDHDGNCYAPIIQGNYLEQVSFPIWLGGTNNGWAKAYSETYWNDIFTCRNAVVSGNFIQNASVSNLPERYAQITLGETYDNLIEHNCHVAHTSEDLVWIWIDDASEMKVRRNKLRCYTMHAYPAGGYLSLKGDMAGAGSSFVQAFGAWNEVYVGHGNQAAVDAAAPILSSSGYREFVSGTFTANAGKLMEWCRGLLYGGRIEQVTIIEATGTLTGAVLNIGFVSDAGAGDLGYFVKTCSVDGLTFARGAANVPVIYHPGGVIPDGSTYRNCISLTAGSGTGTFRVRVVWRGI